ncbi:twin-arginine translocase TatA/TatE family subunit [Bacillus sp. X1(2014)]|uniref:twin-arginine translocase TatA/TatE family subunit n=1 Tax=Bacillus sp. X1(2014) TaxID=1565991 RepID=UPI001C92F81A|nr:twin-arginine translocase TatA/TatE family subunit [Bacillus sp. X1(2014)]
MLALANIGLSGTIAIIFISLILFRPKILPNLGRAAGTFHKKVKIKYKKYIDNMEKE